MWLLPLGACAPRIDYVDHYRPTLSVCDFGVTAAEAAEVDYGAPFYPSEACVDAVLADFDVELAGFLEADGLVDAYGAVRGDDMARARLTFVLSSARALLTLDFGSWDSLTPNLLVSDEFVDLLHEIREETGAPTPGAALYNFAASAVTRTTALVEDGGRASMREGGHVVVRAGLDDGYSAGVVIVHEARHRWGPHGTCPWNPEGNCDPDNTGAHGFGMSALALLYPGVAPGGFQDYLQARISGQMRHILTYTDADGDILPAALAERERLFGF